MAVTKLMRKKKKNRMVSDLRNQLLKVARKGTFKNPNKTEETAATAE